MANTLHHTFGEDCYAYDGTLMFRLLTSEERMKEVKEFTDIRDDDVLVWGYPKSGNHFVHDIVRKLQRNGHIETAIKEAVDIFLEVKMPDFLIYNQATETPRTLEEVSAMQSPRVLATHVRHSLQPSLVQEGRCKVIYILRNPKDVLVSYFAMVGLIAKLLGKEMLSWDHFMEEFLTGQMFYGSWFDHVKDWFAMKDKPYVMCIRYEDLLKDLKRETKQIATFIGKELSEEVTDRIADSCTLKAVKLQYPTSAFIRRGVSSGWKEHFTVAQNEKFDKRLQEAFEGTEVTFAYD